MRFAIGVKDRHHLPLSVSPGFVELADRQLTGKRPCISGNHLRVQPGGEPLLLDRMRAANDLADLAAARLT
jgi:hypothetical protein